MSLQMFDVHLYLQVRYILWFGDGFVILSNCMIIWASLFFYLFILLAFKTVNENDQRLPSTLIVPDDSQKARPGTQPDEIKTVPATNSYFLSHVILHNLLSSEGVKIVYFNLLRTSGYFMQLQVRCSTILHAAHIAFTCFV
jgi:hypothetical protein